MKDRRLCLLFIEPKPSSCSNTNARSSVLKYALLPPETEDHPFCNILTQNGIKIIKSGQIALPQTSKFEILELLIDYNIHGPIAEPVNVYVHTFNHGYIQQLLGKSPDIRISADGFTNYNGIKYAEERKDDTKLFKKLLRAKVDLTVRDPDGGTLLHLAANWIHLTSLLKLLVQNGANVDVKRKDGATALHVAMGIPRHRYCSQTNNCNQNANIKVLLENGASSSARMADGVTPLHLAAGAGCLHSVKLFLKQGVKVTAVTKDGSAPLHKATEAAWLNVVKFLVEKGANVNAKTKCGTTPLHIATSCHRIVEFLLQNGTKVNTKDVKGATPLLNAVDAAADCIVKLLVNSGADINMQSEDGRTALFSAVTRGRFETSMFILRLNPDASVDGNRKAFEVALRKYGEKYNTLAQLMIRQGFSVTTEDASNPDVLVGAVEKNLIPVVQSLLKHGADVNRYGKFLSCKMAPLHCAIQCNLKNMVKLLLDNGADVEAKRGRGHISTPITDAAKCASIEIVKMLVEKGINVRGEPTLLHLAAKSVHPEVVGYMLEEGFHWNRKNSTDETPLSIAVQGGSIKSVEVMVRFGAQIDFSDLAGGTISNPIVFEQMLCLCFMGPNTADETAIDKLFAEISDEVTDNDGSALLLAKHLIKLEAMNVFPIAKNYVPIHYYEDFGLHNFHRRCELETAVMKLENVGCTDITFFEILTKHFSQIACYARNQSFVETLESCDVENKYPIYGGILSYQINFGCLRRKLLDKGIKILGNLCKQFKALPDDLKETVIDFLNNQDLFILQKHFPSKEHNE